jgi:hypothetical protein
MRWFPPWGGSMCEMCKELDKAIEQYQKLARSTADQRAIDRYKELISSLVGKKLELHTKLAEPNK